MVNFSVLQKSICNLLPAFENYPPIVGILFPVPQIMIHQLLRIFFLAGFSVPNCNPPITSLAAFFLIIFSSKYYGYIELDFL